MTGELWVIDPSTHVAEGEGVGEFSRNWKGPVRVFRPALKEEDSLRNVGYGFEKAVVLGSRASVHDSLEWLNEMKEWLAPLLDGTHVKPILGVCFGHQLLAHECGGRVGFLREDEAKLVAVQTTTFQASSLFPKGGAFQVVCSHREMVHSVPEKVFRAVGERTGVPIDVMEHLHLPVVGVQFHPEARMEFAAHCGLDLKPHLEDVTRDGRKIIDAFLEKIDA